MESQSLGLKPFDFKDIGSRPTASQPSGLPPLSESLEMEDMDSRLKRNSNHISFSNVHENNNRISLQNHNEINHNINIPKDLSSDVAMR